MGLFFGFIHLTWSCLVALGVAQRMLNLVFRLHFLNNPFTVGQFQIGMAVGLVVVTSLAGYVVGWIFAWAWNKIGK